MLRSCLESKSCNFELNATYFGILIQVDLLHNLENSSC
jgi:hypothetical protein